MDREKRKKTKGFRAFRVLSSVSWSRTSCSGQRSGLFAGYGVSHSTNDWQLRGKQVALDFSDERGKVGAGEAQPWCRDAMVLDVRRDVLMVGKSGRLGGAKTSVLNRMGG